MKKLSDEQIRILKDHAAYAILGDGTRALTDESAEILRIIEANNAEIEEPLKRGDLVEVWDGGGAHEIGILWGIDEDTATSYRYVLANINDGKMSDGSSWKHARKLDLAKLLEDESGQDTDTLPCECEPR